MKKIPLGSYSAEFQSWGHGGIRPDPCVERDSITIATFNIWFGRLRRKSRHQAILDELRQCDADIIAMQEVTRESLEQILEQDWIRRHYWSSDIWCSTFKRYGVLLLSRLPVVDMYLANIPSLNARKLLMADLRINAATVRIGTVHLESGRSANEFRRAQLETIIPILKHADHSVLVGDFNLCSSWPDENDIIEKHFVDAWPSVRPNDPGFTEDTTINRMRLIQKGKHKHVRFDRVLLSSEVWTPSEIKLLGTKPLADDEPEIFPSDHFGLVAKIHVGSGNQ